MPSVMSCESPEADGTVEANYAQDIVACVRKIRSVYRRHAERRDAAFPGGRSRSQQDRHRLHEAREAGQL